MQVDFWVMLSKEMKASSSFFYPCRLGYGHHSVRLGGHHGSWDKDHSLRKAEEKIEEPNPTELMPPYQSCTFPPGRNKIPFLLRYCYFCSYLFTQNKRMTEDEMVGWHH